MPKNTLQGIIDTNVLIRAFLKSNGSDGLIFKKFLDKKFELVYSDITLKEFKKVVYYPRILKRYNHKQDRVDRFIYNIVSIGKFVYAPKKVKICRDPDDDELLSIAKAIYHKNRIYIVSGDEDLHAIKKNKLSDKKLNLQRLSRQMSF